MASKKNENNDAKRSHNNALKWDLDTPLKLLLHEGENAFDENNFTHFKKTILRHYCVTVSHHYFHFLNVILMSTFISIAIYVPSPRVFCHIFAMISVVLLSVSLFQTLYLISYSPILIFGPITTTAVRRIHGDRLTKTAWHKPSDKNVVRSYYSSRDINRKQKLRKPTHRTNSPEQLKYNHPIE